MLQHHSKGSQLPLEPWGVPGVGAAAHRGDPEPAPSLALQLCLSAFPGAVPEKLRPQSWVQSPSVHFVSVFPKGLPGQGPFLQHSTLAVFIGDNSACRAAGDACFYIFYVSGFSFYVFYILCCFNVCWCYKVYFFLTYHFFLILLYCGYFLINGFSFYMYIYASIIIFKLLVYFIQLHFYIIDFSLLYLL